MSMLLCLQEMATFSPRAFPFHLPLFGTSRKASAHGNCTSTFFPRAFAIPSRTQRIMENLSNTEEAGGAGGAYTYCALKRMDQVLSNICASTVERKEVPKVVTRTYSSFAQWNMKNIKDDTFDILVCGGTLGLFIATALSMKGLRVGVLERGIIRGREQEWNISKKELMELVEAGILLEEEIEQSTAITFNPNRCGFENKGEIWVQDILNLGISPSKLLAIVKKRFISSGGITYEGNILTNVCVYDDIVIVELSNAGTLSCRLLIDSMGNFSPIVRQTRCDKMPDGLCLVVGSCSRGFKNNTSSDIIFSRSSTKIIGNSKVHCFWEAFPAGSSATDRTTYMFTYIDPRFGGPSLEELLEEYWDELQVYQDSLLDKLEVLRVIFGIFPTYYDSPFPSAFDRIIQVGDASGIQSPVSFGGFGSMTRHLQRLSVGISEAVKGDFLDLHSLRLLNPYMPNLSASWLFQRAMCVRPCSEVPETFINELLFLNFKSMEKLGESVLRPFLQDVIQFEPLFKTLGLLLISKPQVLSPIFKQVGVSAILDWSFHFFMLGYYTFLSTYIDPIIRPCIGYFPAKQQYELRRHLEAWCYGAGLDYHTED